MLHIINILAKKTPRMKKAAGWMQVILFCNTHRIIKIFLVNMFFDNFTQFFCLQSALDYIMIFFACLPFRKLMWIEFCLEELFFLLIFFCYLSLSSCFYLRKKKNWKLETNVLLLCLWTNWHFRCLQICKRKLENNYKKRKL